MVMNGVAPSEVRDEMNANAAQREALKAKLAADEPPPLLHPEMARIYRAKVTELATALQEPDSRSEATEALRGLVDAIVLTPNQDAETLQIELRGNLAAMLGATVQTKRSPGIRRPLPASIFGCGGSQPSGFGVRMGRSLIQELRFPSVPDRPLQHLSALEATVYGRSQTYCLRIVIGLLMFFDHLRRSCRVGLRTLPPARIDAISRVGITNSALSGPSD
jgi:hypothetical protein